MIKTQKIIKYVAVAFALLLTFNIISMIMYGIVSIGNLFGNIDTNNNIENENLENLYNLEISNRINALDINVKSVNITIKESSTLKLETNSKYIKYKEKDNKLSITEENHNYLNNKNGDLIIYLPVDYFFDDVSIENGAGKIKIDIINANNLNLNLGAGKVDIQNLTIANETEIDGGAGEMNIKNSHLNNLDLDMGVGKITLSAKITGNSKINSGVGEMIINLNGTEEDYKIRIDKGIGSATLDGKNMEDDTYYGNGTNIINIDGGVGSIKINYSR